MNSQINRSNSEVAKVKDPFFSAKKQYFLKELNNEIFPQAKAKQLTFWEFLLLLNEYFVSQIRVFGPRGE